MIVGCIQVLHKHVPGLVGGRRRGRRVSRLPLPEEPPPFFRLPLYLSVLPKERIIPHQKWPDAHPDFHLIFGVQCIIFSTQQHPLSISPNLYIQCWSLFLLLLPDCYLYRYHTNHSLLAHRTPLSHVYSYRNSLRPPESACHPSSHSHTSGS